jgi:hypothetical protein
MLDIMLIGTVFRPRFVGLLFIAQWLFSGSSGHVQHCSPPQCQRRVVYVTDIIHQNSVSASFKFKSSRQPILHRSFYETVTYGLHLRGGDADMEKSAAEEESVALGSDLITDDCELSSIPSAAYKDVSRNSDDDALGDDFHFSEAIKPEDDEKENRVDSSDHASSRRQFKQKDKGRRSSSQRKDTGHRGENRTDGPDSEEGGVRKQLECKPRDLDRKLLAAATAGDADKIRELVKRGADPDAREGDVAALRALHRAALSGKTEAVAALIELGAPLARKSGTDDSALHYAAEAGRVRTS